jgi:hypothetical protein
MIYNLVRKGLRVLIIPDRIDEYNHIEFTINTLICGQKGICFLFLLKQTKRKIFEFIVTMMLIKKAKGTTISLGIEKEEKFNMIKVIVTKKTTHLFLIN